MKKFSVILIAIAFVASMVVPAVAGDVSISGSYVFDAQSKVSRNDTTLAEYDDDLDLTLVVSKGDVKATVKLEVTDDQGWDGGDIVNATGTAGGVQLVNDYYVEVANVGGVDGLGLKIGQYGVSHGTAIGFDSQGGHNLGILYSMEQADLALYIGKEDEEGADPETDRDLLTLQASLKGIDVLTKANLTYASRTEEGAANEDATFLGIDVAFDAGPVPISIEYDSIATDVAATDGGTALHVGIQFDELVGGDLNLTYVSTNEEWGTVFGSDWDPLMNVTTYENQGFLETTLIWIDGSYKIDDKITLKAAALLMGTRGSAADDSVGTEFDIHGVYALSEGTSLTATYSSWAPGDYYTSTGDETSTITRLRLKSVF